ncbi:MAG: bifunctional folylpolyglutamate synthase/dihydrofolate synthase [Magnetococcales bacterium]|nr:bifunctional folylpolyglutamate synthase/dihydrofolate synthase [Magnetococcales bacterium]
MMTTTPLSRLLDRMALATPPGIHLGLDRVVTLLERMGHPQRQLQTIHVAGTNGKGSVIAFLEAILLAQGYSVARYTSPHLVRFNERIHIQGREVADEPLVEALEQVMRLGDGIAATWFEKITVATFWLLVQQGLGISGANQGVVLLETGMGGRLDATNVVDPLLTLITAIGLDHTEYLGSNIEAVAREKAGILKPGVPAITSCGPGPAREVISARAAVIGAPLLLPGVDYRFEIAETSYDWVFEDAAGRLILPAPGLAGRHQYENAALAVAGARALAECGWPVSKAAIDAGLARVSWPGRLEFLSGTPEVLLDGAHNPLGMTALARFLAESHRDPASRTLIFSALNDKDLHAMVALLAPRVGQVVVVSVGGARACATEVLGSLWRDRGKKVWETIDFQEAWSRASDITPPGGQILVSGSLYLVGRAHSLLDSRRSCESGGHSS